MASLDRIDELKKRYDENPRRFFASLANEYRKAGDLEQAISLCQTHLAEQPGNMNGHVVYGQALYEAGRFDEAKTTFETALTLDPENLIALRHLGDISCQAGANDEAREWYKRVLDADPRNDEIIALLENLEQERIKDAIGGPVASPGSVVPRDSGPAAFKPPTVITPLANQAIPEPTPVVPIEAVETVQIEAVSPPIPPRSSRESIGLMDISLDFETNAVETPAAGMPAAEDSFAPLPEVESNFPAFEEVSLGTPIESYVPAEPLPDLDMGSFGAPEPVDLDPWNPPVVELTAPTVELAAPTVELTAPTSEPVPIADLELEPEVARAPEPEPESEHASSDVTGDMLFGDSVPAEPAPPFVTETMAELYLQQGFTAEALEVYRQLSAANPGDENLQERIRRLEHGEHTSVSMEAVHEEHEEPVGAAEGFVALGAMSDMGATPIAPIAAVSSFAIGNSARAYFAALAARRAVQGNGRATPQTPLPVESPVAPSPVTSPVAPSPVTSPVTSSRVASTLDSLFDGSPISAHDETLALAFSQVAGAVEMGSVAVKGKPTAPAASALSLDSVFRDSDARGTNTPVPRQSQTLRFDQFFATAGDEPAPQQPSSTSAPAGEPGSPAELQQFQSWLGGLKKP